VAPGAFGNPFNSIGFSSCGPLRHPPHGILSFSNSAAWSLFYIRLVIAAWIATALLAISPMVDAAAIGRSIPVIAVLVRTA
jgi:hypothetical protein